MKKSIIIIFTLLLGLSSCRADGRKEIVAVSDIPAAGQQLLSDFFSLDRISVVLKETELFGVEYEVRFAGGEEVVLDSDGTWKKIDCRNSSVPEALVPAGILENVKRSFPGASIVEIEKDRRGHDVELSNGLDLSFDLKYRMRIDD